ncbi:hypothetical protein A7M49_19670 [Acinetobacter baumannii]|nr:hypothetical protein A7M49_19670 [Acinetobacter baumannii]
MKPAKNETEIYNILFNTAPSVRFFNTNVCMKALVVNFNLGLYVKLKYQFTEGATLQLFTNDKILHILKTFRIIVF